MTDVPTHPMERYNESEKISYLSIVSRACCVDGTITTEEAQAVEVLTNRLGVSSSGKSNIMQAAFSLADWRKDAAKVASLNNPEVGYSCLSDVCFIALADGAMNGSETQYIDDIGNYFQISSDKISGIIQIQEKLKQLKDIPPNSAQFRDMFQDISATAGSIGVPLAAVCVSGVWGLSAAGITSGLAALGALIGGGMLAGAVAVVPALGIAGWYLGKTAYNFFFPKK